MSEDNHPTLFGKPIIFADDMPPIGPLILGIPIFPCPRCGPTSDRRPYLCAEFQNCYQCTRCGTGKTGGQGMSFS